MDGGPHARGASAGRGAAPERLAPGDVAAARKGAGGATEGTQGRGVGGEGKAGAGGGGGFGGRAAGGAGATYRCGAYDPFEARVRLRAGHTAVVTVRVDWRFPVLMKAQGFGRGWFNYGGLNGPVELVALHATELSQLRVLTRLERGGRMARVELRVRLANHGPARRLRVTGELAGAGRRIPVRFPARTLGRGGTRTVRTVVTVRRPALWAPGHPKRYDLRLAASGGGALRTRVGLRELGWRGGRLELNGRPLLLHGAGLPLDARGHGDALTAADEARIVSELRAAGANATRAQRPLDDAFLERLDAAGILVWQEVGPWDGAADWTARTPALRGAARRRVAETVAREQSHPSVVAWSLANEAGGAGHPGGQAGWIDAMARELHGRDPGRPVAVDVWGRHLPRAPSLMYAHLDAIGFTDYLGWYESPGARGAALDRLIAARVTGLHAVFPGKVLVATEFGAAGNALNPPDALGGYRSQAELISSHVTAYRRLVPPLSGMLVWNLRDYAVHPAFAGGSIADTGLGVRLSPGLNEKGLFDGAGRAKPALAATRRAFAALPR